MNNRTKSTRDIDRFPFFVNKICSNFGPRSSSQASSRIRALKTTPKTVTTRWSCPLFPALLL